MELHKIMNSVKRTKPSSSERTYFLGDPLQEKQELSPWRQEGLNAENDCR